MSTDTETNHRFADASEARGKGIEVTNDHRITLLVNENPKRGAAAERFARYINGMSVEDAISAGITKSDIRWDVAHEYVQLEAAQ